MRYLFKPLGEYHLKMLSLSLIPIIPLDIGCVLVCLKRLSIEYIITCIVLTIVPFLIFIVARLVYPKKYIIDTEYLTKYCGNNITFKIKKSDIKAIIIKRSKPVDYFKFLFDILTGYPVNPHSCCISFLYINNETRIEEKTELIVPSLQSNTSEFNEYTDFIPYSVCKKICALLNITPSYN